MRIFDGCAYHAESRQTLQKEAVLRSLEFKRQIPRCLHFHGDALAFRGIFVYFFLLSLHLTEIPVDCNAEK